MRRSFFFLFYVFTISCGPHGNNTHERIITTSIPPFKYFIEAVGGEDFKVNIMVPRGSDPHVYEPLPDQISKLRISEGYISNGYLGFEMNWLARFYETNPKMKRLSLDENIKPIESGHEGDHIEGADPHYWVSPKCALIMASSVRNFLTDLNPAHATKYEANYMTLISKIQDLDSKAKALFSEVSKRSFMIYHPNLAYLARDYNLREIAVESDGKEPSPSRMKELIDLARKENLKTIFVQREYDSRNAKSIAGETGAKLVIIDPLSEEWFKSTSEIIDALKQSLN